MSRWVIMMSHTVYLTTTVTHCVLEGISATITIIHHRYATAAFIATHRRVHTTQLIHCSLHTYLPPLLLPLPPLLPPQTGHFLARSRKPALQRWQQQGFTTLAARMAMQLLASCVRKILTGGRRATTQWLSTRSTALHALGWTWTLKRTDLKPSSIGHTKRSTYIPSAAPMHF